MNSQVVASNMRPHGNKKWLITFLILVFAGIDFSRAFASPAISADGSSLASESCSPANQAIDPGETVTVDLSLKNVGTDDTINLVATLLGTDGVIAPSGPQTYGVLTAAGAPVTKSFTFRASGICGGTLTATLQLQDGATDLGIVSFDFVLGNLACCLDSSATDLRLAMTSSPNPITVSNNLTYSITVTNNGPGSATGVTVTDPLPGGVDSVSANSTSGTCSQTGGIIICDVGSLASGTGVLITVVVTPTVMGNITNSATVAGNEIDPNLANNSATAVTVANPTPAISINDVAVVEGNSGTTGLVFSVSLSVLSSATVTVDFATANGTASAGTDYVATSGSLTFPPGTTTRTISVIVNGDTLNETNDTVHVNLSSPVNASLANRQGVGTILNDDAAPTISINDTTVTEGNTGTTDAIFTVSLSAPSELTATVSFSSANGSAFAGIDYMATSGTVVFPPGTTNQPVAIPVINDTVNEATKSFVVVLSNPSNATLGRTLGTGTVLDNDPLPSLSINDVTVSEGNAGTTDAGFTVTLSAASGQTVSANYATANGTATAGSDYVATNGIVTFPAGTTSQTVTVMVNGDTLNETNETFVVDLSNPFHAALAKSQGIGTILNDDPVPSISINDVTVTEGESGTVNANFTVSLSAVSGQTVTVDYTTANGTAIAGIDFVATNGSLTFPPGTASQTVTVRVIGDTVQETNQTFAVNLANPINATLAKSPGVGTIVDNDPTPALSIADATVTEGNSGTTSAIFMVSLSTPSELTVTVNFASANGTASAGSDFIATSGTLTVPPGTTNLPISVLVNGDTLNEANETFLVNLSSPLNASLARSQGVGTILNDDPAPSLSINDVILTEGNSGTVSAIFTVSLSVVSGQTVTVNYATTNGTATLGSDFVATNGNLTFTSGSTSQSVTVVVNGDSLSEADETFFVNLSSPVNATLVKSQGVGTILDDDPLPSLSISDVSVTEGNAGATNAVFTVSLSVASGQTVTVNFSTADGTASVAADYVATNGSLTFPAGSTSQTLTVRVNGDTINETNETFVVNLSSSAHAAISRSQGVGTIIDDDLVPAVSIDDVTVPEGNTGTTNALFTVSLSDPSGQAVTLSYATANGTATAGSDFVSTSGTLTFLPGVTNQPISVVINRDTIFETNETFFVNLSNPTNATLAKSQGVGTINNDDSVPAISINDVAVTEGNSGIVSATFTVTLSAVSALAVSVDFATADGTATVGIDYVSNTGTVVFPPGTTNQIISILVNGDTLNETNETFFVSLFNPTNAIIATNLGTGTINNDDPLPSLSINNVSVTEGNSGTVSALFNVNLSTVSGQSVTVNFVTANGTATAGADFVATNGTLSFPPGATSRSVTVLVSGDTLNEADETFVVNLTNITNAAFSSSQGIGTILNDDPIPALSINNVAVLEGSSGTTNAIFTVSLSAASGFTVTVDYSSANGTAIAGSDYVATNRTLAFISGATNQVLTVRVNGDNSIEPNENFFVNLSNPVNATLANNQGIGTIVADETRIISLTNSAAITIPSSGAAAPYPSTIDFSGLPGTVSKVTATLRGVSHNNPDDLDVLLVGPGGQKVMLMSDAGGSNPINNVTLTFDDAAAAAPPDSGQIVSGTFKPSNNFPGEFMPAPAPAAPFSTLLSSFAGTNPNGTWSLFVFDDSTGVAGSIASGWVLTITTTNLICCSGSGNADLSITVSDSRDPALTEINLAYVITVINSGPADATGVVVTNTLPAGVGFVSATSSQGSCSQNAGLVACNLGNLAIGAVATTTILVAPPFPVAITNSATVSGNESDLTPSNNSATTVTAVNLSSPFISINDVSVVEPNVVMTNAVFAVSLSRTTNQTITVDYATANGTGLAGIDYLSDSGTVTFPPNTATQYITVAIIGDTTVESNETFFVNLSNPANGTISRGQGTATIINNDGVAGQLDHFNWGTISATQLLNCPFPATATAVDPSGATVSSFNGTVNLSGSFGTGPAYSILITEVDTGTSSAVEFANVSSFPIDISGWLVTLYDWVTWPDPAMTFTTPNGTICQPSNTFVLRDNGTSPGTYPNFFTGANLLWLNDDTNNQVAVLLRNAAGKIVDFVCAVDGFANEISDPMTIPSTAWQGNPIAANLDSTMTYQRAGNTNHHTLADWVVTASSMGTKNSGLTIPFPGPKPVSISPTAATFVGGVWTGNVTLRQLATNMLLSANDGNGHQGSSGIFTGVTDTLPPSITCPANRTVIAAPGQCTSNVTFNVTATDNCAVTNVASSPSSGFAFPVGVTTVTSTARDSSGNASTCSFTVSVIDNQLPAITCPANLTVTAAPGVCVSNVTFSVTATDNCAVTNLTSNPPSGFAFPVGVTTVTGTARDRSGNSGTCSFTVTVNDTQPPAISCPGNITVNTAPGGCASNVTFTVTASDNCAVTNLTSSPASGFAFPVGVTTVTSTARDRSGNSSTCSFTVTVNDTQPPALTCPANFTVNAATGGCTSNVTFTVSASDNCAVTNVSNSPSSGFAFPVGVTTVTSTARDSSGNSSTCSFTVTVNDTQPPQITCPANLAVNAAPGVCSSNVTFTVTATDNCALTNVTSVPASGFAFPIGVTTVTSTARDSSGNSSTCSFTVTVLDNQPPQITCPANLSVNAAPGACTSNVTFTVTATDNCALTNVTSVPASGFAFPAGTTTVTSTARDSSGNSSSCSFTVTVVGTPMNITDQPANVTACNGGTATFTAAASGALPIAVQWQGNTGGGFTNLPNATTTTLSVPANASTVGSYRAVFTNPCGTNTTASATLTVGTSLSCNIDGPEAVCPNAAATLFTAPGFNTYQWSISGNGSLAGPSNNPSVPVNAGAAGSYTLTLQVSDTTGCLGTCSKVVPIQDLEAPAITCPTNRTVNAAPGACTSNVTFTVSASDNCLVTNLTSSPSSGFAFPVGVTTVTSAARDSSGNSSTCTFTVTVIDNQPPQIACPGPLTVSAAPGGCASNVTFNLTANDNCALRSLTSVPASGFAFPVGTTTVTSTARDTTGNTSTCAFTVTVLDTQPPAISCPEPITVNAAPGVCVSNVTFTLSATDNCAVTNLTSNPPSGLAFPIGVTTVTSTARDSSGNSRTCTFTVTVIDTQPPAISCPGAITVNAATGACRSNVTFTVTASDNCAVTNLTSNPPSGFAFPVGTTTVISTARDSNGNSSTCAFTVTVVDTQPPQINCPANFTVNAAPGMCVSNVTFSVTATDNCTVTNLASTPASGFAFPVGATTVTSTAGDSSGNTSTCTFTVTVNDTQPPQITCPANLAVNAAPGVCASNVTFNVTATDNCAVTNVASSPSSGFAFPVGVTTVTSTARDSSGNASTCSFTVSVIDNQLPAITCPANLTVTAAPGVCVSNVTFSVTATDNCAVTNLTSNPPSGFAFPVGVTTVTGTARDRSGNSGTCSFTVTVNDTQPPAISCPGNITVNTAPGGCASNVTFTVTASDNCAVTNLTSSPASSFAFPVGVTTVTSTARDRSGNSSTCSFTVTVNDTQPPALTCPANFTVNAATGGCTSNVTFTVSASDNCAVTNVSNSPSSGFAFPVGVTTVTSTARDSSGNSSTCSFTVTVNDTQPPQITCPANLAVNAAPGVCSSNVTFTVTATDNCALTNVTSVPASGFAFPIGVTTVTSTARDSSGNSSTCSFTVTVLDNQPPQITCPANLSVNAAPGACTSNVTFTVTATDNCALTNVTSVPASGFAFPAGTTTVTSTARDNSGNSSTCTFTVTVVGTPMNITDQPADVRACNDGTATFTAAASGALPIAVQWQANTGGGFTNLPNATTTTLSVPANASTVGSYRAVFTNPCGTNTTASATLTVGTSLSCNIDGPEAVCPNAAATLFTAPGFNTYQWSISGNGSLAGPSNNPSVPVNAGAAGSYTLALLVSDTTGCLGTCSKVVPIQDLEAPAITCPTNRTVNAAPGDCTSNVTFTVSASDNCLVTNLTSSPSSGFAFPVGVTTVTSAARDSSGNSSTCTFTVTVIDNQPPQIACPGTLTVSAAPGGCASNVTFNLTANDNCALRSLTSVPASGFAFPVGTTTVTSTARDTTGNTSTCAFTVTVLDTQPPAISCPEPITVNAAPGVCVSNVTFTLSATDNCAVTNLTSNPPSGLAFPIGVTTVTSTARDSSGNSRTCTFTVTVIDTQPPAISCPGAITVNAATGACRSNVTFTVTASDNCAVTNLTSNPPSGFAFPVGTTTVISTARDSNGNSSTCAFTVTVVDTQPPQINCPANFTVNAAPGMCVSNVTFSVTATDNCTVTNLASTPASGFAFPVGATTVTSTAGDSSGNTSTCTFTVTVNDTQPPQITCPANLAVNAAPGVCASNVTFNVTATDNCAVTNVASSPSSGFAFPVGVTTVTSTARDSSGNASTCSFTVSVNDTQPPAISCPGNITVQADGGQIRKTVTFQATATDNCTVANLVSVPPSGFAFPIGTTTVTNTASDARGNSSACTFTVTVLENQPPVNSPPVLNPIADQTVNLGETLTFTMTAFDPDTNKLTFTLDSGAPLGASVEPNTGVFTWTPGDAQGASTNVITARVTDDGVPILSDASSFTVITRTSSAPSLTITLSGNLFVVSSPALLAGYDLETSENLGLLNGWTTVTNVVSGAYSFTNDFSRPTQFFRLKKE